MTQGEPLAKVGGFLFAIFQIDEILYENEILYGQLRYLDKTASNLALIERSVCAPCANYLSAVQCRQVRPRLRFTLTLSHFHSDFHRVTDEAITNLEASVSNFRANTVGTTPRQYTFCWGKGRRSPIHSDGLVSRGNGITMPSHSY